MQLIQSTICMVHAQHFVAPLWSTNIQLHNLHLVHTHDTPPVKGKENHYKDFLLRLTSFIINIISGSLYIFDLPFDTTLLTSFTLQTLYKIPCSVASLLFYTTALLFQILDIASAITFSLPGTCLITILYSCNSRIHLNILWLLFFILPRKVKGLWSVNTSISCFQN